jgi:hypothetical protein
MQKNILKSTKKKYQRTDMISFDVLRDPRVLERSVTASDLIDDRVECDA